MTNKEILNHRINFSKHANKIAFKIKEGYEPNEADIFELLNNNKEKIKKYRDYYNLKKQILNNKIIAKEEVIELTKSKFDDKQIKKLYLSIIEKNK